MLKCANQLWKTQKRRYCKIGHAWWKLCLWYSSWGQEWSQMNLVDGQTWGCRYIWPIKSKKERWLLVSNLCSCFFSLTLGCHNSLNVWLSRLELASDRQCLIASVLVLLVVCVAWCCWCSGPISESLMEVRYNLYGQHLQGPCFLFANFVMSTHIPCT